MKDGPAARTSSDKVDFAKSCRSVQQTQIDLQPWILISADDHARPIDVEEEDRRVGRRPFEEEILDAEIEERIIRR